MSSALNATLDVGGASGLAAEKSERAIFSLECCSFTKEVLASAALPLE